MCEKTRTTTTVTTTRVQDGMERDRQTVSWCVRVSECETHTTRHQNAGEGPRRRRGPERSGSEEHDGEASRAVRRNRATKQNRE